MSPTDLRISRAPLSFRPAGGQPGAAEGTGGRSKRPALEGDRPSAADGLGVWREEWRGVGDCGDWDSILVLVVQGCCNDMPMMIMMLLAPFLLDQPKPGSALFQCRVDLSSGTPNDRRGESLSSAIPIATAGGCRIPPITLVYWSVAWAPLLG